MSIPSVIYVGRSPADTMYAATPSELVWRLTTESRGEPPVQLSHVLRWNGELIASR